MKKLDELIATSPEPSVHQLFAFKPAHELRCRRLDQRNLSVHLMHQ